MKIRTLEYEDVGVWRTGRGPNTHSTLGYGFCPENGSPARLAFSPCPWYNHTVTERKKPRGSTTAQSRAPARGMARARCGRQGEDT